MSVEVLSNAYLALNSVNVSSHIKAITPAFSTERLDSTTMGSSAAKIEEPGLTDHALEIEYLSDFTNDAFNEDQYILWKARTKFLVEYRPRNSAVGATNPKFTFTGFIANMGTLGGVGQLAGGNITFGHTTDITRATA